MATNKSAKTLPSSRIHVSEFLIGTTMSEMHKSAFITSLGGKVWMHKKELEIRLKEFQDKRK